MASARIPATLEGDVGYNVLCNFTQFVIPQSVVAVAAGVAEAQQE